MPRPWLDQTPDVPRQVAAMLHEGRTHQEIADLFHVARETVSRHVKDARVQAHLTQMRDERINRVTNKIDSRLLALIETPDELRKLDIETLLKIRKELLPPPAQRHVVSRGKDEDAALADLQSLLLRNPDLAAQLGLAGTMEPDGEVPALPAPDEEDNDE